jgi:hypothetical protein
MLRHFKVLAMARYPVLSSNIQIAPAAIQVVRLSHLWVETHRPMAGKTRFFDRGMDDDEEKITVL